MCYQFNFLFVFQQYGVNLVKIIQQNIKNIIREQEKKIRHSSKRSTFSVSTEYIKPTIGLKFSDVKNGLP